MQKFTFFLLLCTGILNAQNTFQKAVDDFVKKPSLNHASISISVLDLESNTMVAAHQPNVALIPASTLKLLVTATALGILGPDFIYSTEILAEGNLLQNGILDGNLVIKGSGDPTLGSLNMTKATKLEDVEKIIISTIKSKQIKAISGYIIGDETIFSSSPLPDTWQWDDLGNYYGAGSYGLNILDNTFFLEFERSLSLGSPANIKTTIPFITGLNFKNEVKLAPQGTGDQAYIFGDPLSSERMLRGTIPVGNTPFRIKGALPNPPLFLASKLKDTLQFSGIETYKGAATRRDLILAGIYPSEKREILARFYSPPMKDIIHEINLFSVNMYAEAVLKTLAVANGLEGSTDQGIDMEKQFWIGKGLNFSGVYLKDGSGLSARNAVPARFITDLLRLVYLDPVIYPHFYQSLPIAGISGNQKERMKNTAAAGNLRLKSGTLERVKGYAGFFEKNTKKFAFSILVNNYDGTHSDIRNEIENLMIAFCK
jgi:serine-type D-Ala-D-Ala carboxypeptidase/endopeptidase (penicillin-binding protein 4)